MSGSCESTLAFPFHLFVVIELMTSFCFYRCYLYYRYYRCYRSYRQQPWPKMPYAYAAREASCLEAPGWSAARQPSRLL
jgi:hypothetical protein